jgi:hypothetical protein
MHHIIINKDFFTSCLLTWKTFLEISKAMSFLNKLMLSQGANGMKGKKHHYSFQKKGMSISVSG